MRLLLLYILTDWINRPARKSIYIAIINEYANRHTLRGSFLDESLSDYRYYLSNNRCRRVPGFVLLANVNSRSRSLYAIARPSVCLSVCLSVCNVRAPYSGGSNFRQYFYGVRYLGHPLAFTENFTEIVPEEPLRRGS